MGFDTNLNKLMKQKNITYKELADRLHFEREKIRLWSIGLGGYPSPLAIKRIADYFDITTDELIGSGKTGERFNDKTLTIYAIKCINNDKLYIGCTSRTLKARLTNHMNLLRSGKHTAKDLQSDFNKFGEKAFEFYMIEDNIPSDNRLKEKEYMEQYETYKPDKGYNSMDQYFRGRNTFEIKQGLPL